MRYKRIQCDKCKGNMELINISGDYIASFGCEGCRTKKTTDLGEEVLKKNFKHTSRFWECDEKFRLMIREGVYPYEYMGSWKKFEETSVPPKDAFYSRLNMKGLWIMNIHGKSRIPWGKRPLAAITIPTLQQMYCC